MSAGILFSQMEPPAGQEDEFHRWYEEEHIPARMVIPGFIRATRYRAIDGEPSHLAVYELSDLAVLQTPEYQRLKSEPSSRTDQMLKSVTGFTRFICSNVADTGRYEDARYLSVVAFEVPEADMERFNEWYEVEHTPLLMECEDWLRVSRFRRLAGEGGPWNSFALHELRSLDALRSPERDRARAAPMRNALASDRPWFDQSGRWAYELIAQVGS